MVLLIFLLRYLANCELIGIILGLGFSFALVFVCVNVSLLFLKSISAGRFFLNTSGVRKLANSLQTQWFDSTDVEIEAGKLATAGAKQVSYDNWQRTLDVGDREPWVDG